MKHVTIKDIARELMVSVSTVSRALVDDKNIRPETKEKVLEAARRLGYRRNPVATNLKYGHTNTVGVIVPEMITPFAAKVVNGIQDVLYRNRIKVVLSESSENPQKERECLGMMEDFMVDGIIVGLCSYKENREVYRRLLDAGMPIVFYDRLPHGWDVPQVVVDDYMKAFFLVERIIRGGRKQVLHIAGAEHIYNSVERERGYVDAMWKFGLRERVRVIQAGGMSFDDGAAIADRIVAERIPVDAVFAFTDTLAIGAMNRLRELGFRIPEDVAVASFSGTELSAIVHPQLTTVEPPLFAMGCKAAELLLERMRHPEAPRRTIMLDAEIKMRASTGSMPSE